MATRLLDWRFNPLAALWFAVQNKPGTGAGVLWVLQSEDFQRSDGKSLLSQSVLVVRPRHIVGRIASQLGMFTLQPFEGDEVIPLEQNPQHRESLRKLLIQPDSFADIRWVLDRCGINAATIFPGLDGLCRHLEWAHTFAEDEASYVEPAERAM